MIQQTLEILRSQLADYILQQSANVDEPAVVLGNIGLSNALGGNESYMQERVVLSLVNIMEEMTLKNTSAYRKFDTLHETENPPSFLNLYLLFTANFNNQANTNDDTAYTNSLLRLSQIIEFFQGKNLFTVQNSPAPNFLQDSGLQDLRIKMEIYSLTFEQVNHLWGSMGGKQVPFVMYKAGVVAVKREHTLDRGAAIQDVKTNTSHLGS